MSQLIRSLLDPLNVDLGTNVSIYCCPPKNLDFLVLFFSAYCCFLMIWFWMKSPATSVLIFRIFCAKILISLILVQVRFVAIISASWVLKWSIDIYVKHRIDTLSNNNSNSQFLKWISTDPVRLWSLIRLGKWRFVWLTCESHREHTIL